MVINSFETLPQIKHLTNTRLLFKRALESRLVGACDIYLSDKCSLLLICYACHQRNDQLSASWQDYLDTSY